MAYREPGVEMKQVQEVISVAAEATDLMVALIGPAYKVVDLNDYTYGWIAKTTTIQIPISGLETEGIAVDEDSFVVELLDLVNNSIPVYPKADVTKSFTNGNLTLSGTGISGLTNADYRPKVSYRAQFNNKNTANIISSADDIKNIIGKTTILNPLGFAANLLYQNSNREFIAYAISGTADESYTNPKDDLEFNDAYAFAVLNQDYDGVLAGYVSWINDRSKPENGLPSKLYISPFTPWVDNAGNELVANQLDTIAALPETVSQFSIDRLNKTAKLATANAIAGFSAQISNKRVSVIHPDFGWLLQEINILQTNPDYVKHISEVSSGKAVLAESVTLLDGSVLLNGTIITASVFAKLVDTTKFKNRTVLVYFPVAGYHFAVQRAALVASLIASDPKTGFPLSGITKVGYSEKYFGKEYTNIIAGGGTEVIVQPTQSVLPSSRHHLTTDMTSVETREDNILHQVDIVTINFRKALLKLVGRFKQDAKYYKILRATLSAYSDLFVRKEFAKRIDILEIKQSTIQPDKILVTIRVYPYYAANYIDVTIYY